MTHQEDPLLATWRYGLGRSVAFTSDAKAKWGVLWVRWGAFNKFWSQVTRWTLRTGTRSDTVATVSRTDDVGGVLRSGAHTALQICAVGAVGRVQQVLVAGDAMDAAHGHA